jgi:hypothetical protein
VGKRWKMAPGRCFPKPLGCISPDPDEVSTPNGAGDGWLAP